MHAHGNAKRKSVMSFFVDGLQPTSRFFGVSLSWMSVVLLATAALGQQNFNNGYQRQVGGVLIDGEGVLSNATVDALGELRKARLESLERIPVELNQAAETRKISLRRLEATINDCLKNNKPLPDAVKYLAGLQRIRYVFVYPEQKDIVLVGPGEGWKIDAKGAVVGAITGRPVMLLDDLLVALRTARRGGSGRHRLLDRPHRRRPGAAEPTVARPDSQ